MNIARPRPPLGSPDLPAAHVIHLQRRHFGAPDEERKSGGKEGKEPGVGKNKGEGTAGLLAGQRRLAEAAAAARPQVPRPEAAPPPPVSAPPAMCALPSGLYRCPLPPQPANTRPVLATSPKFRVPFKFFAPSPSKASGAPGLPCSRGGGNLRLPAYCHPPGPQAGPPRRCFLPLYRGDAA